MHIIAKAQEKEDAGARMTVPAYHDISMQKIVPAQMMDFRL